MVNNNRFSFPCGETSITMSWTDQQQQVIIFECTFNYHKYTCQLANSNETTFKYYKSCLLKYSATFSINQQEKITLMIPDLLDSQQIYEFSMERQEISSDEKISIMFNQMMDEITSLKQRLWFSDDSINKFNEKYVTNWSDVQRMLTNPIRYNPHPNFDGWSVDSYDRKS